MNNSNYYIIAGISIICLVVNLLHLQELDLINKDAIKKFRFLAVFIILEIVIDSSFTYLEGNLKILPIILYILKALEFSLNPVLPYLILKLFNTRKSNHFMRWVQKFQLLIISVNLILQIISIFKNFMFVIDKNNNYQRTQFTIVYAFILILSALLMLCAIYVFSKKVQNTNILTLFGLFIMIFLSFSIEFLSAKSNFDWLCISISFFVIDIYYVSLALRLDPLTQLLNRQVYSSLIDRINFSTLVFMIDINFLKKINDTYGHECGDKTLKSIAKCIYEAYGEYGWCFRIGGDEFCVILKPKAFKKLLDKTPRSDIYVIAQTLIENLDKIIKNRANKDKTNYLQYGVSQGYSIFYSQSEYPSIQNNTPINQVIKHADEKMYIEKAKFKENFLNAHKSDNEAKPNNSEFIESSAEKINPS